MGFQVVLFLPSTASFYITFLRNPQTATCFKTVDGGKQGHAHCKIISLQQSLCYFCKLNAMEIIGLTKLTYIWLPSLLPDLRQWYLFVCCSITKLVFPL